MVLSGAACLATRKIGHGDGKKPGHGESTHGMYKATGRRRPGGWATVGNEGREQENENSSGSRRAVGVNERAKDENVRVHDREQLMFCYEDDAERSLVHRSPPENFDSIFQRQPEKTALVSSELLEPSPPFHSGSVCHVLLPK